MDKYTILVREIQKQKNDIREYLEKEYKCFDYDTQEFEKSKENLILQYQLFKRLSIYAGELNLK